MLGIRYVVWGWAFLLTPCLGGAEIKRLRFETVAGKPVLVETQQAAVTVVAFLSAICPMAGDYSERIADLHRAYSGRGVRFLLVNANAHESNDLVTAHRKASGLPADVLRDPHGEAAAQLKVFATPSVVVLDRRGEVRYWGAIDDSRQPARVKNPYLARAIDATLAGLPVAVTRTKVMGCSIKASSSP